MTFEESHREKHLEAATGFRLPYWDYFRPRAKGANFSGILLPGGRTDSEYDYRMPEIFNLEQVMIRLPPDNRLQPQDNPLYTFAFSKKDGIPDKDWNERLLVSTSSLKLRVIANYYEETLLRKANCAAHR